MHNATDALQQLADVEVFRANICQRVECATKHVVAASVFAGALDGLDVFGFFDHADHRAITPGIMADAADALAGDIAANAAKRHPVANTSKRLLEAVDVFGFCVQNVEGNPLGTFRPNPRQAREFVDEVL